MIHIMMWMNLKHIVLTSKSWSVLFWVLLPFPSCSHHTNLEPHYSRPQLIQSPVCLPPAFQFCVPFQNNLHKTLFPYVILKTKQKCKTTSIMLTFNAVPLMPQLPGYFLRFLTKPIQYNTIQYIFLLISLYMNLSLPTCSDILVNELPLRLLEP